MEKTRRVVVAMSGGVDSSVAAALLKQQGYEVVGMMMRLWSEPGTEESNRCCTPDAMAMARRVAACLGISFYAVDAQRAFHNVVVQSFLDGYLQGSTPNPCVACNRQIRWEFLLQRALAMEANWLATGHYASLTQDEAGRYQLRQAVDASKDQSYVLHVLSQDKLSHALFPLSGLTKPEVRQLAREFNLPVAERPESQDLCFLAGDDYRGFLQRNVPHALHPGPILNSAGQILGEHQGLALYTIGQRKGLGISAAKPLFVLDKDLARNALIVGPTEQLGRQEFTAGPVNWIAGQAPAEQFRAQVKIRYKASPAWGTVFALDGQRVRVELDQSLRDITPGQAAVFYDGDACLGGGAIER